MEVLSLTHVQTLFHAVTPQTQSNALYTNARKVQSNAAVAVKHGGTVLAHKAFDEMPLSSTFAWNNLIQTSVTSGDISHAILVYQQMLIRGVCPDKHTLPRVLAASRLAGDLLFGKQVHGHALKLGLQGDRYVGTALIEMYGWLDSVGAARSLFDKSTCKDSVLWTVLARLYVTESKPQLALDLFGEMVNSGVQIDSVALATAIGACGRLKSLHEGRKLQEIARRCGLESDVLVGNSLLQMYIDCESIIDARAIFDQMPSKDVISWTTIIHGYVKQGGFHESLKLFQHMNKDGIKPDALSISTLLPACARMTACKHGKEIHGHLLRSGMKLNLTIQNAIMDMYMKAGYIEYALKIFKGIDRRDVISWTVMILGYSLHGEGNLALSLFHKMEEDAGVQIDELAYGAVLHACVTACAVEEGKFYFNCIRNRNITHCTLMVSLLARAGLFDEASAFIEERQIERHVEVLRALLDGCRIHREVRLGKRIIEQLCELEPLNADNYVLQSNWFAHHKKWDMVDKCRGMMNDMGLRPQKAYSWIEHRNKVHTFGTGDVSHPRSEKIYWQVGQLMEKMQDKGPMRDSDFSLHDVDEERECSPMAHSEMLAVSFGLISKQAGTTIRVTKNHRVCDGCHDALKAISKLEQREVIVKDLHRFYHFRDGLCSCCDLQ
ncbi:putative pentatricopeptide repeat-containing protein At3g23330 [Rhodamnia argentea]|uniref:Pentatricopeptide repeat-containing protein At3g23330 n=1 Tax=Rhodamnia argentea TaxID=178133 RepID=A0A8B8QKH1_9MYRT|nr:putative pentatricopeptide repeat-containing protein At3g23330 [Rhodamnia argentea]